MNLFICNKKIFAQNTESRKWEIIEAGTIITPRLHTGNLCLIGIHKNIFEITEDVFKTFFSFYKKV